MSDTKPEKWATPKALKQINSDLRDGTIDPHNYKPKDIYDSREIYQQYEKCKFRSNMGRAVKQFINGESLVKIKKISSKAK